MAIAYASKGGISISDTDEMSPYDRELVLRTIVEIKEAENNAIAEAQGMRT